MHQAVACADAGVTLIPPLWEEFWIGTRETQGRDYGEADDPGVQSVVKIYNYYKKFGCKTQVMGASFRDSGEIRELAARDLLTIVPKFLAELDAGQGTLERNLKPEKTQSIGTEDLPMDQTIFEAMHAQDHMAREKLKEGIEAFSKSLEELESLLVERVAVLNASEN